MGIRLLILNFYAARGGCQIAVPFIIGIAFEKSLSKVVKGVTILDLVEFGRRIESAQLEQLQKVLHILPCSCFSEFDGDKTSVFVLSHPSPSSHRSKPVANSKTDMKMAKNFIWQR